MQKLLVIFFMLVTTHDYGRGQVIARLVKAEGRVYFKRLGMDTFSEKAEPGSAIKNGDEIKIGSRSFAAVIYIDDRSVLKIRENTKFSFMDTRNSRTIDIKEGTVLNKINKKGRTKSYRIQTPVSVASVKGTEFAAIVNPSGVDQFICKEGTFEVLNMISGETVRVNSGEKAVSNGSGNLVQAPSSPGEYPPDPEIKEEIIEQAIEQPQPEQKKPTIESAEQKIIKETSKIEELEETGSQPDSKDTQTDDIKDNGDQKNSETTPPKKPFAMGLGIGSSTIDGVLYNQISLRPEINFGKLGIGLDLMVYIDNEGNIREEEWDIQSDPSLLLDKLLYIRYGTKIDPIWAKYGSIDNMTLGYGGLMQGYSNMMQFPTVRKVGVNTGFNYGPIGGELFFSNLKDIPRGGTVTGLRISYRVSDDVPLTFGINYITDANIFSSLSDKDDDSYPDIFDDFPYDSTVWNDTDGDGWPDPGQSNFVPDSLIDIDADGDNIPDAQEPAEQISLKATPFSLKDNSARTTAISFDMGYPLLKKDFITMTVFAEFNRLNFPGSASNDSSFVRPSRSGSGITIPGIRSTIFKVLNISLEYRMITEAYVPQYFDQAYDINRVTTSTVNGQTVVKTKDMNIFDVFSDSSKSIGLFGSAGMNLFDLANFSASYTNMRSDTTELKSFSSYLSLNTDNIPKISAAMAYYQRNNDDNPFDFENPSTNTILGYRIGYEMSKGVSLIWDYRQSYRDDGTGKLEMIKQTNIETTFSF